MFQMNEIVGRALGLVEGHVKDKAIKTIEETIVALNPLIVLAVEKRGKRRIHVYRGLALRVDNGEKGIILSYDCDNMGQTLVHEALHVAYPMFKEYMVEKLEDILWNYKDVKKAAQKKVVEAFGYYERLNMKD